MAGGGGSGFDDWTDKSMGESAAGSEHDSGRMMSSGGGEPRVGGAAVCCLEARL